MKNNKVMCKKELRLFWREGELVKVLQENWSIGSTTRILNAGTDLFLSLASKIQVKCILQVANTD